MSIFNNSLRGAETSERFGTNFPRYVTMPKVGFVFRSGRVKVTSMVGDVFGGCVRKLHDGTNSPEVVVLKIYFDYRGSKMAVNFNVTITENYDYVHDFEKVKGIIRDHELTTTTKFALFKAPKDFGRKGKLAILKRASVLQYEYSVVQT